MSPGNESRNPPSVAPSESPSREPTACILCECNCGIQVRLGGNDGRRFVRIPGDRANPVSRGRVCQKAGRLNHCQNSRDRLLTAMWRRPDGSFEGLDHPDEPGERTLDGTAPREPTSVTDRDPIACTPWHKSVPARLERLTDAAA